MDIALEKVRRICEHWPELTRDELRELLSPDCEYVNVPAPHTRCVGPDQAYDLLTAFAGNWTVTMEIRHIVGGDGVVLTERVERFTRPGDPAQVVELRVMGAFEIENDMIVAWRDYFDSKESAPLAQS